jgi:hypothetical protein
MKGVGTGEYTGRLALALAGLIHPDTQMVRAAYLAMEVATRAVIVPLAFGTLATGLIVAIGTRCGSTVPTLVRAPRLGPVRPWCSFGS